MHEACKEYANNRFPCTSSSSKHSAMAPRHRGRAVTSLSRLNVAIGSFISRWTVIPEERARVECIANPKDCGTEEPGCQTLLMGGNKLPEARGGIDTACSRMSCRLLSEGCCQCRKPPVCKLRDLAGHVARRVPVGK